MASSFKDFSLSFRTRFIAWKILSDGRPINFFTQQLPTTALLPLNRLTKIQISIIGKWLQRQVSGWSASYISSSCHSYLAASQWVALDNATMPFASSYSDTWKYSYVYSYVSKLNDIIIQNVLACLQNEEKMGPRYRVQSATPHAQGDNEIGVKCHTSRAEVPRDVYKVLHPGNTTCIRGIWRNYVTFWTIYKVIIHFEDRGCHRIKQYITNFLRDNPITKICKENCKNDEQDKRELRW